MQNRLLKIQLGVNKPFFLDKNDHFWVVTAGNVEIYYVKSCLLYTSDAADE